MAIPGIPTGLLVQQGNGSVYVSWDIMAGATTYVVNRSTDGVNYSQVATPATFFYLDTAVTVGVQYWYQTASQNTSGTSSFNTPQTVIPTNTGDLSLGQLRLMAQQRADMVGNPFVGTAEWNTYINQSAFELYDLLITVYEDYNVAAPLTFQTTGADSYDLSTVAPNFYKLNGVDCGLAANTNAWITLKKFDFISRNRYVFPQITTTFLGVFNLRYRVVGDKIYFIPTPSGAQFIRIWYTPRMTQLLQDTDIITGISGWTEYVIVDAAIKAMQKEESDTSVLMGQKMALRQRIEESAMNRDIGSPDTISNTRSQTELYGGWGPPNGDGGWA